MGIFHINQCHNTVYLVQLAPVVFQNLFCPHNPFCPNGFYIFHRVEPKDWTILNIVISQNISPLRGRGYSLLFHEENHPPELPDDYACLLIYIFLIGEGILGILLLLFFYNSEL